MDRFATKPQITPPLTTGRRGLSLISLLLLVSLGCFRADLRDPAIKGGIPAPSAQRGRELWDTSRDDRGRANWSSQRIAHVILEDAWNSKFYRQFTPLELNTQRVELLFHLGETRASLRFLDGPSSSGVIGFNGNSTFVLGKAKKSTPSPESIRLYLGSLQVYFELPMRSFSTLADLGRADFQGRPHQRIFMTDGDPAPSAIVDQYVVWVDAETRRPSVIEFTYRSMLQSYRGSLILEDYREVSGIWVPFSVKITDDPGDETPVHELKLLSVRFE